jgi:myb proto-oncogene protein
MYMYIYKKLILGFDPNLSRIIPGQQIGILIQYCKELEEGR